MRRASNWTPRLQEGPGRLHERLTAAIAEAILLGELEPGEALPAHRTLAADLERSVGTVTRAYDLLQRRGLARSEKGRGMFVADTAPPRPARLDLSVNLPPSVLTTTMLSSLVSRVAGSVEAELFNSYAPAAGLPEHRATLARIINDGRELAVDPDNLIITNGAQHGIFIALAVAPEGPLAIEELSYPGALRAARTLNRRLLSIGMDDMGVRPDALLRALATPEPPRTLYLMPSLQNPTGATMDAARRAEIVATAREHDLTLIEDDVYCVFAPRTLPPLAQLAPERVFYVGSLSKSLAPGLRVGYLVAPADRVDACIVWLQATQSMANPLSAQLMEQANGEGLTRSVSQSVRSEARRRNRIAREMLNPWLAPHEHDGLHVWLPMPTARARDIVLAAARLNITLAPPEAFMADPEARMSGLRLCLGTLSERDLRKALAVLADLLSAEREIASALQPVA